MEGTKGFIRKCGGWDCVKCGLNFATRALLALHKKEAHKGEPVQNHYKECFCKFCGRRSTSRSGNTLHEKSCKLNPQRVDGSSKGYKMTEEQRKRCSDVRKRTIAKNGGIWWSSRSKCKRSYAEEWILKILHNEVQDQNFVEEYHLNKWFMDFAWPKKQIYIEIDGSQHEWPERKLKDQQKDEYYRSIGWKVLRLPWRYCCNNTQEAIKNIIDFVDNAKSVNIYWEDPKEKAQKERQELIKQGKVNSLGRACSCMLSFEEWEKRKNLILNCGVNLNKFGCLGELEKKTGLTRRQIKDTIEKFNIEYKKRS